MVVLLLVMIGSLLLIGFAGSAQIPVTVTITSFDTEPSVVGEGYYVRFEVVRAAANPDDLYLYGTMTLDDGEGNTCSRLTDSGGYVNGWSWGCTLTTYTAGVKTITATFTPLNPADFGSGSDTASHTVNKADTSLALAATPDPSVVGETVTLTASVTTSAPGGGSPTGTVTFKRGATAIGAANLVSTGANSSQAVLATSSLPAGTYDITANYGGSENYTGSSDTEEQTVNKRTTTTLVMGSDTALVVNDTATCTVIVEDTSPGEFVPVTGTVTISVSPTGEGSLTHASHTLSASDAGQFTFTYTPSGATTTPHTFTATYAGDSAHEGSSGTFEQEIQKRALDMEMTIAPTTAYVLQPVSITVHMEDDTTEGTPDSLSGLEIVLDNDGKTGTFSDDTPTLNSNGDCTVTYTPGAGDAGSSSAITVITASYEGSEVYAAKQLSQQLTVELRPTLTTVEFNKTEGIYVYEPATFTVTVVDTAGTATDPVNPEGSITLSAEKTFYGGTRVINELSDSTSGNYTHVWNYDYLWTALIAEGADYDVVTATYDPDDGIHLPSEGSYGKGVNRRPTEVTITCVAGTPTGFTVLAQVTEKAGTPGLPSIPLGNFVMLEGDDLSEVVVGVAPVASIDIVTELPMVSPTILYSPNNFIHVKSPGTPAEPCTKIIDTSGGGDGTTGGACADGCGSGGVNIDSMIWTLNAESTLLHAVQMGLSATTIVTSFIPNPVWAAGLGFSSGTDIPIKEIVEAILNGTSLALEVAIVAMQADMDGDGIPDVIERNVTGTDPDIVDTDADAMSDADEIGYCAGYYGGTLRPNPNIPDSDSDGLLDGYELAPFATDVCVADTDCDTLPDGVEVACRTLPAAGSGFDMTTFAALGYSAYTFPFADLRDHPDPREGDTDGDGLNDFVEFGPGDLATSTSDSTYSPYVNDSDSDGDGILDGNESTDGNATWDYVQIGGTGTTGSGETHLCLADTDGDGLSDGEEEALFGRGPIEVHSTLGTITTPALDDDSDDDGLSDYEEQVVTHTDPLNWDSDGDSLSDSNEMLALSGAWPMRTFAQVSDPLDPDTDDDGLRDDIEYTGTGLGTTRGLGGSGDEICPYVNDDDSDDDGLQDGAESWDGNGTITLGIMGDSTTQAQINPSGETDFCNPDTDGDGLTDGEEVALLGGLLIDGVNGFTPVIAEGVSTVFGLAGAPLTGTVPPLDDDSDNDGLSDYEEIVVTGTDPLDQDSDNDTLSDANELIAIAGTWPHRSFIQVSDPLDPDTDDDDIPDQNEYPGSGLGTSRGLGGTPDTDCPYVNDDDSDNDGLQDGVEDANHDGTWGVAGAGIVIGSFGTQSSKTVTYWETDPCNPDTDGDGIRDGEEANLIGGGPTGGRPVTPPGFNTVVPEGRSTVTPVGPDYSGGPLFTFVPTSGPAIGETVPALDVDSDNDGLSDYEEVMVTGTDPLDADSDNDTLLDADELIATGGTPGATPQRTFDQESDPLDINTDDDHLFDPVEGECGDVVNHGTGLSALVGQLGGNRDTSCPYINDDDSDNDGVQDGAVIPISRQGPGIAYSYIFIEGFADVAAADIQAPGTVRTVVTAATGEQDDDALCNVCDADSDGDGLTDGEEVGLGTDPQDWDTDDDGRNDWHEMTGGGPIPTDPFDPDTDDDGLLDSAEVFGANTTNPVNADTDGDGLCDGGAGTPYMTSGHPTVVVNPVCKSCSQPGNAPCGPSIRTGSPDGIGDHPNPMGLGEDENGNGNWDGGETDPNQFDTDGDADGDGIEKLGFSTSRQSTIPSTDMLGQAINVLYPDCGCLDPLNPDTDGDGISDGVEDLNHDGNFDFNPSDFDFQDLLDGAPQPDPEETNPCDPDTDNDGLNDYLERNQPNPSVFYPYNPTNPLDHDTDNDYLFDGEEVFWICIDPGFNLDPNLDGIDDYFVMTVLGDVLDPTNRDSDSDGFIDGLDPNPCYSWLIPIGKTPDDELIDEDGDGFSDADELAAGTDPNSADDFPAAFVEDFDRDLSFDDAIWFEDFNGDGVVDSIAIDLDQDYLVDARIRLVPLRDIRTGDFDEDGEADDLQIVIEYAFSNGRYLHPRTILTMSDFNSDFVIDEVLFAE